MPWSDSGGEDNDLKSIASAVTGESTVNPGKHILKEIYAFSGKNKIAVFSAFGHFLNPSTPDSRDQMMTHPREQKF